MCGAKWSTTALADSAHLFHQALLGWPLIPGQRRIGSTVHLSLANSAVGAANGQIFHRAAEAAHGVALEVREDYHRIVVDDVAAHGDFLKVLSAFDRERDGAFFVHDVDGTKRPAVDLRRFPVVFRRVAAPVVKSVRFDDRALRNLRLKGANHRARKDVGTVPFASMKLDGHLSGDVFVDKLVELKQMLGIQVAREVDLALTSSQRLKTWDSLNSLSDSEEKDGSR